MASRTLFKTALTASDATAVDPVGAIREENDKVYKYVKFDAAVVAGDVVKYDNLTDYLASEVGPSTSEVEVVAGVALATHDANDHGWIQIGGLSDALSVDITGTTPAVNDLIAGSATTKAFKLYVDNDTAPCGVIADVTASSNRVHLNCQR